jgi:hypothetical protein
MLGASDYGRVFIGHVSGWSGGENIIYRGGILSIRELSFYRRCGKVPLQKAAVGISGAVRILPDCPPVCVIA